MDVTYHTTTGAYVPYVTHCGGIIVPGSPSPPLSLCSEPIFQLPMPDIRCGSPGQQQKTPKIQILNKTMVDAQRKKMVVRGHNLPSRIEPPDMMNFFQTLLPFSDHYSDSGDGSVRGGSLSPRFQYTNSPYTFPTPVSPLQYTPIDTSFRHAQVEQKRPVSFVQFEGQNQQIFQQQPRYNGSATPTWRQPATSAPVLHPPRRCVQPQTQKNSGIKNFQGIEQECSESDNRTKRKHVKPRKAVNTNKKKGLIITRNAESLKTERTKRSVMLRKQRKRVQQKNKSLHKTELCTHWMLTSACTYKGKCYFAHGIDELQKRVRVCNYKTRPCVDCPPESRRCSFGSRCNYCHPGEAIRRGLDCSYVDKDYYRDLKNEFKDNEYPFGIFI